ncbi:hypothetical protein MSIBF_A2680019 [groundwater metagenome]|uniref:Uncharacterized protein n=1 Tax=groundwater metagenome TaxID=717931 RepID=A0A098E9Q8_9ZZZZ
MLIYSVKLLMYKWNNNCNYSATPKITGNLKIFRFLKIENLVDFQ